MILANGKLYNSDRQGEVLAGLEAEINQTLAGPPLAAETVISAIHTLGEKLTAGEFDALIAGLELDGAERYLTAIAPMLRREALEYKLKIELGENFFSSFATTPPGPVPAGAPRPGWRSSGASD